MRRLITTLTAVAALAAPSVANACPVHEHTYNGIAGPIPYNVTTNLRIDGSATGRANCKLMQKVVVTFGNWKTPRHAWIDGNYWRAIEHQQDTDRTHENPYMTTFAWDYWHGRRFWVRWEGGS